MWSSTQVPHILRLMLAMVLEMPESKIRVIAPDVGGGFGGKLQVTPEEFITMMAARQTGKPCKYTETRSESLMAGHHGRAQVQKLRLSATKDGTVTALDVRILCRHGRLSRLVSSGVPILGAFMYNSIYKFPAYRFECTNVFTNKVWTDAYRGAGRPEATFAIERLMDELAVELDMDPLQLRRQNWIEHDEFPFTTVAGLEYDSGNYEAATDKAVELFGYDELRAEQKRRRDAGERVQLGIGISTFTEMCGLAPSRVLGALSYGAGGWEHADIRVLPTGKVEVVTGASAHGQGHETAWSQIVADRSGVPFEDVEVLHGDTQVSPKGLDTYGSRSLTVGGIALVHAADKVIEKAKTLAAHLMEANRDDIEFAKRAVHRQGHRPGDGARRALAGGLHGQQPAGRVRAEPRLRRDLRSRQLLVPARHASRGHGGRHRDRRDHDHEVRLRRRHRQRRQPDDRRGPGARRARPGHRAGLVRGGRPRRRGHARHRLVRRLPRAERGRRPVVHRRTAPRRHRPPTRSE